MRIDYAGQLPAGAQPRTGLERAELPRAAAPEPAFAAADAVFPAGNTAALTFAIVAINGWNRLAAGLGSDVTHPEGLDFPGDAAAPPGT